MTLTTTLFETEEDGKKCLRGRTFEIHLPNASWERGYPRAVSIRVWYDQNESLVGKEAIYEKREEWLNNRLYRIYYVRTL